MKPPSSKERWLEIAENYYKRTNFPNCVGSVDGKHSGSAFYNYKKFYSVVLLAVVDSEYRFIAVDVGAYGRDSDSNIFNNWNFGKKLTQIALICLKQNLCRIPMTHLYLLCFLAMKRFHSITIL
nr:unnamed protein product [Callosobruchus chinensis]